MVQHFFKDFHSIPLNRVDGQNRFFAISLPWFPLDSLLNSIQQVGILSPLHLQETAPERYRVIIGWRRFWAARQLGLKEVPGLIRAEEDQLRLFTEALQDNAVTRPLHLLEKAQALLKLRRQFEVSDEAILGRFMPLLDLPPQRFQLDRCLTLARLSRPLQEALLTALEPEIALKLVRWDPEEQIFFLQLLCRYRPGKNKQKQLFALLDELRAERRISAADSRSKASLLAEIWEGCGAAQIDQDEQLPLPERLDHILDRLHQARYPFLSEHERKYTALKSSLRLPPQIQLHLPRYFEGSRVEVSLLFRNPQELKELACKLQEAADQDELKEILDLL